MICPQCGNPNDDAAAYCGVCYEVLRKKEAGLAAAAPKPASEINAERPSTLPRWSLPVVATAIALFVALAALRARLSSALGLLDMVNLAFHEAGHPIFGVLSLGNHWMTVWGGTLMQLLMPAAAAAHFYKRGERASSCACLWWFGQNFLGIGDYMADARAQVLPLLGSGEHDWTYLFETMRVLVYDVQIGRAAQIFGCLVMAVSLAGIWVYWPRQAPK